MPDLDDDAEYEVEATIDGRVVPPDTPLPSMLARAADMPVPQGQDDPADDDLEADADDTDTGDGPVEDAAKEPEPAKPSTPASKPPKGKNSYQDRINELTWHKRESERKEQDYTRQLAELRQQLQTQKPTPLPTQGGDIRPKVEDFKDYETFVEALADWRAEHKFKSFRSELDQQTQQQSLQHGFADVKARGVEKFKDFEDNQYRLTRSVPLPDHVVQFFLTSSGPDVAYALGNDLGLAARIAQMPPLGAAVELGRLSARLEAASSGPAKPPLSNAKSPIKPVSGAPHISDEIVFSDDESFEAFDRKMDLLEARSKRR